MKKGKRVEKKRERREERGLDVDKKGRNEWKGRKGIENQGEGNGGGGRGDI